ncbi:hypothetical protein FRC12_015787 [Ceratobasidium sp. 428]|nr:hypothetical protein FRC12_015787 [Ceratobasidium sp. 428]
MIRTAIDRVRGRQEPVGNPPNDGSPALGLQVQTENPGTSVEECPPLSPIDPLEFNWGINERLSQPMATDHAEELPSGKKPQLPVKSANDQVVESDVEFLRGIGREAQVWTTYVKETKEFDDDMVEGWNKSLDVILLFAALFSAILTAFVLESVKQLGPDKVDQTVEILRQISSVLQSDRAQTPLTGRSDPSTDAEFRPTRNAVWVNCLWFLSLSLSVAVSLAAMLAKQWCYYYLSGRSGDNITQAEERQKRYGGLAKWRMQGVLEHLPMLMHIALALFSVGLILYLWDINVAVASTVSAVTVSALCFYLGTISLPVLDLFCPFKTTQSVYARILLGHVARWLSPPKGEYSGLNTTEPGTRAHWTAKLGSWAVWKRLLQPFLAIKNWIHVNNTSVTEDPRLPSNWHTICHRNPQQLDISTP